MSDLTWEISYLERNLKPTNQLGQELSVLNGNNSKLQDSNIEHLSKALSSNSVFEGGLYLSENLLTDQSVLSLCSSLSSSSCKILVLDLSFNFLKEKSGVYLGDLLSSGYQLSQLYLKGCDLGPLGVQRILENIENSETLEVVDIGLVGNEALAIVGKYVARAQGIKQVAFQQGEEWNEQVQKEFIYQIKQNFSVLLYEIGQSSCQDFVDEVYSVADRNNKINEQRSCEKQLEEISDPKHFAEEIQNLIENDLQNLPVRVYLQNAIGSLLNDGIFALMKYRYKENNPNRNTAVNNVKWLVRYILDNSRS
jgi:Ran GTPase-activating protein (RanGAP) involved in mRNA processing and transport